MLFKKIKKAAYFEKRFKVNCHPWKSTDLTVPIAQSLLHDLVAEATQRLDQLSPGPNTFTGYRMGVVAVW